MNDVNELERHKSPATRPQPLAVHHGRLWMGSWDTDRVYAIDPASFSVIAEFDSPGKPYGLAVFGDGLRAVVSIGDEDDRYFFAFDPARGFDLTSKTPCPDFTGSHLAADGDMLYLGQMGNRRILVLDGRYKVLREIPLPTRIGGMASYQGTFYVIAGDEELENLRFATLDIESPARVKEVARLSFDARSLAFDGSKWWTSHRDESEIVAFTAGDAA